MMTGYDSTVQLPLWMLSGSGATFRALLQPHRQTGAPHGTRLPRSVVTVTQSSDAPARAAHRHMNPRRVCTHRTAGCRLRGDNRQGSSHFPEQSFPGANTDLSENSDGL